jgi:alkylhydroperoxidase family enzyme
VNGHLGDLVAPLVDGQLDHDTRDRALVHITHCAGCQHEVAFHRAVKARLSSLGGPDLPSLLVNRIVGLGAGVFAMPAQPVAPVALPVGLPAAAPATSVAAEHRPAPGRPVVARPAGVRADRRRAARRTVLGSAAAVVLTVGGGATLAGGGSGASAGTGVAGTPTTPATPVAVVVSQRGADGRLGSVLRPLPGAAVFGTVAVSFSR